MGTTITSIFILCIMFLAFYLTFIRNPNNKFTLNSDIRVVRRNNGYGNIYYPEYLVKKWIPFKNRNVDGLFHVSEFTSVDSALDFINSQRIKFNQEEEIMVIKVYSEPTT